MKGKPVLLTLLLLILFGGAKAQLDCAVNDLIPKDTIIICADTTFRLQLPDGNGLVTYAWGNGETDDFIDVHQTGKYYITATDANCSIDDSVYVLFNSLILIPNVRNELLCLNVPASPLRATGQDLKWYTSPTAAAGSPTAPVPSTADTGVFNYYVSQTILGCESPRAKLVVEVIEKPYFHLGENVVIPCGVSGVMLQTVKQKYTSYTWQDGSTRPDFTATEAGNYVLRGENICGSLVDTVTTVTCNTKCVNFPTAFTPNNDGLNEVFRAGAFCPITKFNMVVYDRFGKKVFETKNPAMGWDGKINGKRAEEGTYVYFCVYDDFMLKRELTLKGSVTLLR
ncbi:MAG: gliding motility-associated C-terminal domain-containing protein [Chitinophagaceae bacterium]|nr:gliding motility-associated C-terminal domain-containing protein [Chitinophagaceae bacterium]